MTENERFNFVLSHFKVANKKGSSAQCVCPCHDDKQASLTVSAGNKSIVLRCHAGCKTDDILAETGLRFSDLFFGAEPKTLNWRSFVESREKRKIEAVYNYFSLNGEYAFTKMRLTGKKIIYGILKNEKFVYGLAGRKTRDFKAIYGCNPQEIKTAISKGETIYIPEGEKDVDTLKHLGYAAFSYGGASDWQCDFASLLHGAKVVILADNDEPGRRVAEKIFNDVKTVARDAKIIIPTPHIPHGDVSDFFEAGHTREELEIMIGQSGDRVKKQNVSDIQTRLSEMQAERISSGDKGYSRLFADIFQARHRYNPHRQNWMKYDGARWKDDLEGLGAHQSLKEMSDELLKYVLRFNDATLIKTAAGLNSYSKRVSILNDSKSILVMDNEMLDRDDYILNTANCAIDLRGENPRSIKHSPDLNLSKIANVRYEPTAKCPLWEKVIAEVLEGDLQKIRYVQKLFGICLTGCTEVEGFTIFDGRTSRNGKSTVLETIGFLLGDYAQTVRPESFAVKKNPDSRTASPDIAKLAGCRLAVASEPPKRMMFDIAMLKTLTGRDKIVARNLFQREFTFVPKLKLIFNTNHLPLINDDTVFASDRVNVVEFNRHFSPEEQDRQLKDKLIQSDELSGILNWCVQGWKMYQQEGLLPPEAIRKATESYREDCDKVATFINECLIRTGGNSSAKSVYEKYTEWCADCGIGCESKTNFFSELKAKNIFGKSGTVHGRTTKNIVVGYEINDFTELQADEIRIFAK